MKIKPPVRILYLTTWPCLGHYNLVEIIDLPPGRQNQLHKQYIDPFHHCKRVDPIKNSPLVRECESEPEQYSS